MHDQIIKNICLFLIAILFSMPSVGQELFSDSSVIKIELQFSQPNFWQLLEQNKQPKIDIPATLIVNDTETYDSVGVRFKGNSSYSMSNEKKPFNITMDEFIDDQDLWGVETFNLGNAFMDPTYVREIISYDIFRKYMPAGKTGYVRLFLNGEYWGLYVNVQQVNKDFLREWFPSGEGNLYKGDPRGRLNWIPNNEPAMQRDYEKKTNEADLENELPRVLNVDRAIWYIALCNILVNLDSYIYEGHNYFIYNSPSTQQFNLIPWDMNESFGCFPPHRLSVQELEEYAVFYNINDFGLPLISRIFRVPHFRSMYLAHYRTLLNREFHPDSLLPKINQLQELIHEHVQNDTRKLYPYEFFTENVINPVVIQDNRIAPGILTLVENRRDYLLNDPDLQRAAPIITSAHCSPETLQTGTEAIFCAEVSDESGLEWVSIYYKIGVDTFSNILMLDDGLHNDNDSGDGIYGCSLEIKEGTVGNTIDYYILAKNRQGEMKFFPERAEFEYLSAWIKTGSNLADLVINEFMAGNTSTIQDPQGQYDDWIELYNRNSEVISVKGMYLTDDLLEPKKWAFPDTSITGHGYLLIWTDNDAVDQPGLHTDFRLNKSGESIGLFDTDENRNQLTDAYTFGPQEDDISTGLFPNGEADFMMMVIPTPGEENLMASLVEEKSDPLPTKFTLFPNYPNPFNPVTTIRFIIPQREYVAIKIYDIMGKEVLTLLDDVLSSGEHSIIFNADQLPNGVYVYRLNTKSFAHQHKMLLLK